MRTLFVLIAIALPLSAHDTWIAATTNGETIQIDVTSGQKFPAPETALKGNRFSRATIRQAGAETRLPPPALTPKLTRFAVPCVPGAIAMIAVELAPKALELNPKQVNEYLKEIGQPAIERTPRWRESYTKHAKSYVRCSDRSRDFSWRRPAGMRLEIMPAMDPSALVHGRDWMTFQLIADGKPLVDFPVTMRSESGAHTVVKTDASGKATVGFPVAGRYLLAATVLHRSTKPDLEWESDFTTLALNVW